MKTYLVGGAVRDKLLNYPVLDRDWVVVGANAEKMLALGYTPVGADFPVYLHPTSKEEYALARTERKNGRGYKGFSFHASENVTLEQDLSRRDLTINAIAEDSAGQLTDPFNGQQDLTDKILRHVSPAFSEDPLRVLRVARFAARYAHLGFKVADETLALMQVISESGELQYLSKERIWQELERALGEKSPLVFFQVLSESHALERLFPELKALLSNLTSISSQKNIELEPRLQSLPTAGQRLAWLFFIAQQDQASADLIANVQTLCRQLRCPNTVHYLIKHTATGYPLLSLWASAAPSAKLNFIQSADLLRSPLKVAPLLAIIQALDYRETFKQQDYLAKFSQLLKQLREIDHQALIKQGFKGAQLGLEIKKLQLLHCENS